MKRKKSKQSLSSKNKDIKCLSIDLGSSCIKFAIGQKTGRRLKVDKIFSVRLVAGIYANGYIYKAQSIPFLTKGYTRASVYTHSGGVYRHHPSEHKLKFPTFQ